MDENTCEAIQKQTATFLNKLSENYDLDAVLVLLAPKKSSAVLVESVGNALLVEGLAREFVLNLKLQKFIGAMEEVMADDEVEDMQDEDDGN